MRFAHLHGHSTYSFLDGYGTTDQVAARIAELGHTCCAQTDHGNIYGHVPWQKSAAKAGIRPLFGCEMYVVDDMRERTRHNPSLGVDGAPHVTVLAKDQRGYENLLRLVTIASNEGFYYKPRVDWDEIARHQEGLVVLSGCVGGFPSRLALGKDAEAAWHFLAQQKERIENFFVELVPQPGMCDRETGRPIADIIMTLAALADDLGLPTVMTADAHFPRPEDHKYEDMMVCISMGTTVYDQKRYIRLEEYQHYCSGEDLLQRAMDCAYGDEAWRPKFVEAIERAADIADMCQVEVPKAKPVAFCGRAPEDDPADVLRAWVEEGFNVRKDQGLLPAELEGVYRERAEREFKVIAGKGFADYLLTITDIARWAKSQNTLVMCRGSAGGCLLLWLLRCSETDSIRHELSFERFYDETRNDPPDVDMDFETWFRPKVIEYIYSKYGRDRCSQVATLTLMRAKNAVQDVASIHNIPAGEYAALSAELDSKDDDVDKQIDAITDPQALAVLDKYPVLRAASRLVGQARQQGVNAAGFIISSEPLNKAIATIDVGDGVQIGSVDKHGAADIGLLKLDLLGVAAYDVLGHAVRKMGMDFEDLYRMPVGDQRDMDQYACPHADTINGNCIDCQNTGYLQGGPWRTAYDLVARRSVVGVFQIDGSVMRVAEKAGLDRFEELYAASALCRPGAMDHVPEYARNKHSAAEFEAYLSRLHPIARDIVKSTYGILVYQEQVMAICRLMGKMPWPQIHKLRKRIASASFHGFELGPEYSDDFFRGCRETGVSDAEAAFWWSAIKAHGIYSFNKSHCVTYGIVGYWMLWLKANHPERYYEAFLHVEGSDSSPNPILMKRLVREYTDGMGGEVRIIDPVHSKRSFDSPRPGLIVGGWENLRGVAGKTADAILARGPFADWADLRAKLADDRLYYRLHEAGLTGERDPDVQAQIALANWVPVTTTGPREEGARKYYGFARPGTLPIGRSVDGDVAVGGYLTAKWKRGRTGTFRGEQIIWILEDECGITLTRVSRKMHSTVGQRLKACSMGDFLCCSGWWNGSELYVKEFVVISHRE